MVNLSIAMLVYQRVKSSKKGGEFLQVPRPNFSSLRANSKALPFPAWRATPEAGGWPSSPGWGNISKIKTSFGGDLASEDLEELKFSNWRTGEHWKTWKLAYLWLNHHQSPTLKFWKHVENLVQYPWRCDQRIFKCDKPKKTHLKHLKPTSKICGFTPSNFDSNAIHTLWWTNIAIENGHRNSGFSH